MPSCFFRQALTLRGGELEQTVQRSGIFLDVFGKAAGDELPRGWKLTIATQRREPRRISVGDRNQAVPNEQWQIMIARVLFMSHQRRGKLASPRHRQALQC